MSAPRWQKVVERALEQDGKANVYQLASTSRDEIPRVRTLAHRSFLTPSSPSHPLLLTSTDIRTPKLAQFAHSNRVELTWWLPPMQEQLRIGGRVHVLPSPDFSLANCPSNSPSLDGAAPLSDAQKEEIENSAKTARDEFALWTGKESSGGVQESVEWEGERRKLFESMSGHMRASWVRPVPGTHLVAKGAEEWPESLPKLDEVDDHEEHVRQLVKKAFRNFALVVIEPSVVDYVELGVMPNRRTWFERDGEGLWSEQPLVP